MNQIDLLILFFYSVTKNDEKYQPALISLEQWLLSENFMLLLPVKRFVFSFVLAVLFLVVLKKILEGGIRGVRKPQNRTKIRQNTANASDLFLNTETARHVGHNMKADVSKTCDIF